MSYRADLIKAAAIGRLRTAKACRDCARQLSGVEFPESVYLRISTRKKLYNFLEALGIDPKPAMHAYNLSVPRDRNISERVRKDKDPRPEWLSGAGLKEDIEDYIF